MIQDIKKGDMAKKELAVVDSTVKKYEAQTNMREAEKDLLMKKYVACQATNEEYSNIDALNQSTISSLKLNNTKLKRQRNGFAAFAAVCVIGLFIK